jgi:molecular chaperone HtpG
MLEQKLEKSSFTRVDGDVIEQLIRKEEDKKEELEASKAGNLSTIFQTQMPTIEKANFSVLTKAMGEQAAPVMITQSEYMRRMKEMSHINAGMSFYGEMPDMYNIVLNTDHALIKGILSESESKTAEFLSPIEAEINGLTARKAALNQQQSAKKSEEITEEEKKQLSDCEASLRQEEEKKKGILGDFAKGNNAVHQLIDLALLQNGLLKGEALNNFVKRSIQMI